MDKASIEVAEPKEQLYFFNFGRAWPFRDFLYFGGVYADISCRDNNPKVFNNGLVKKALFRLEIEVILCETL
jgi:hypothetical protein